MEIGIVTSYDSDTELGVVAANNNELSFKYGDGQNMIFDSKLKEPTLSGKHEQPEGFSLKEPDIGDPIAFMRDNELVTAWGYLNHYIGLAERKHPTRFVAA
ncbi:hypothetical protein EPO04_00135 [Patescibacteria group bacterium]|nr:MAG: hypothetical protein EPO04_00135 [Patescibacteria group bacterium]